jgi:hypothetical protein
MPLTLTLSPFYGEREFSRISTCIVFQSKAVISSQDMAHLIYYKIWMLASHLCQGFCGQAAGMANLEMKRVYFIFLSCLQPIYLKTENTDIVN